jgi:hypothetical protein
MAYGFYSQLPGDVHGAPVKTKGEEDECEYR